MDNLTKKQRSYCMSRIKGENTKPEKIVRKILTELGWYYKLHGRLPGKPDIVIPKIKTVIFINGCFWHQHNCRKSVLPKTNKPYWAKKLKRNIEKQKNDIKKLGRAGWKTIVIWECQTENKSKLIKKIRQLNEKRKNI